MDMKKTSIKQVVTDSTSTNKLLMVMIALLVRQKEEHSISLKRQVEILKDLGMRPVDIAETLGKTSTHINKELSGLRKNARRED
jgi:hypothetical protein